METLRKVYDVCLVNNVRRHCLLLRPNASSNHRTDTKVVKKFTLYVYVKNFTTLYVYVKNFTLYVYVNIEGQKETSRTYCKHSRHLSVCEQFRKRSSADSSTASSSQLFPGGYAGVRRSYADQKHHQT